MPHKLLLADDSVTIQRVIELTFADEDISVIAVGDGRKAIERVQTDRPDIVLADVGMPERDGYEVAAFVKGTPTLAHIPVLLLTGAFEPIDEGRAQAAGCDGVLVKPFEPQMVISRVKDLIAGRRPVQKMPAPPPIPRPAVDTVRPPARVPVPDASSAAGVSADEYFDRLDAAFSTLDTQPARIDSAAARRPPTLPASANSGLGHELANWHPELDVQPDDAATLRPTNEVEQLSPAHDRIGTEQRGDAAPGPATASGAGTALPTLAEAFAALLTAESGRPVAAAPVKQGSVTDDLVEQVTRRVIERMGDAAVRDVVIEVSERLVAEEIARIKATAR